MAALRAEEATQKQAAEEQKRGKVQKVAVLESQIANDVIDTTPCPTRTVTRPVIPRALHRTETYIEMTGSMPVDENTGNPSDSELDNDSISGVQVVVQSSEVQLSDTDFDEDTTRVKKKKKDSKPKLRDTVNAARREMTAALAGGDKGQLTPTASTYLVPRDGKVKVIAGETRTTCVFCCHESWLRIRS